MKGRIKNINHDKGYGFIKGEDGREYFFYRTALKNIDLEGLEVGQEITFEDSEGEKGPRAEDVFVQLVQEGAGMTIKQMAAKLRQAADVLDELVGVDRKVTNENPRVAAKIRKSLKVKRKNWTSTPEGRAKMSRIRKKWWKRKHAAEVKAERALFRKAS